MSSEENLELLTDTDGIKLSLSKEDGSNAELEKTISLWSGLSLIVGMTIGSGIFASPGPIYKYTNSTGMALIIWVMGGFLAITGGLCYAELGTMIPASGGEHRYLEKAFGTLPAFLFSWTGVLVTRPGAIAIITVVFAEYLCRLIYFSHPVTDIPTVVVRLVAISCVITLTAINCFSTKLGTRVQDVFTVLKLISTAIIGLIGLVYLFKGSKYLKGGDLFSNASDNPGDYALALYSALWAFDGWNNLNLVTGELKEASKNLPKAVIFGPSLVIVCYLFVNIAYYAVLPPELVKTSSSIAMDFGKAVFGNIGGFLIPLVVVGSTFGAANASVFTGSRVSFVSAKHGHSPELLSRLHPKFSTPVNALLVQCTFSIFFISIGSFTTLVNIYSVIAWIFYLLAVLGLLVLRYKDPLLFRPFKVWLIVPFLFCAVTVFLISFSIKEAPFEALGGIIFMISGIPVWYFFVNKKKPRMDNFKPLEPADGRLSSNIEWNYMEFEEDFD